MTETDCALAYLKECGQLDEDIRWVSEFLKIPNLPLRDKQEIVADLFYHTGIQALKIVRGEIDVHKPELRAIIARLKANQ